MRTHLEIKREIDDLTARRDTLATEADALSNRSETGQQERRHRLIAGSANLQGQIERLNAEWGESVLRSVEDGSLHTETVGLGDGSETRAERSSSGRYSNRSQAESGALRAVEQHRSQLTPEAGDRLERVIRDADTDPAGLGARYLAAVGTEAYRSAFWRIVRDPTFAHLSMTPAETEALREVRHVSELRDSMRAMSLTGSGGGFAVPFALDPSIMLTGGGAVNPLRQVATVRTIAVDEWRGITSAGVTAAYAAEATATTDNSPTLVQPTISTEKAQAFIPFSIEIGQDWATFEQEMAALLRDAKDTLESTKFTLGSGTNEPFGVITGATTTVGATAAGVFDSEDLFRLMAALPPRYQARAAFMGNLAILNKVSQMESAAGARLFPETAEGRLLRRPMYENSAMTAVTTTGALFLIYGDFSRFVIVDRIGLSIELIPHLFDTTNNRPTGQRGLYCYFRNSSKVVDADAFRVLIGLA